MNYIINYIKVLIIPILVFLFFPLVMAIVNLIGLKTYQWFLLVVMIVTALISGFYIGKKTLKRGYIQGLIFGVVLVFLMFVFSLFGKGHLNLNSLLYYLIIIVSSTVGSMFGIQKKVSD